MALQVDDSHLIPLAPGQAVGRGWTQATDSMPMGITWHWTATRDLAACNRILGGATAERKGEASAHYGVGRSAAEGVARYVSLENRSWHAGTEQTLRWDGQACTPNFKGARATIGIETVNIGYERKGFLGGGDWIDAAVPNGKHVMRIQPWPDEQIALMIELGKDIVARWPGIGPRDHHGHHDLCPGYKVDVIGFPFARILRGIYDDASLPDVWSDLWLPEQRQRVLIALGYNLGPSGADGDWGRLSDAALRRFQKDRHMLENGMWTTFTCWEANAALEEKGLELRTVAASG